MTHYEVRKHAQNSWHPDGSPIVEDSCGHKHRRPDTAARCLSDLRSTSEPGMYCAHWYHGTVVAVDSDGSARRLTDDEEFASYDNVD